MLDWFWQLDAGRTVGMDANPITWPEIAAWAGLMGLSPEPWELRALRRLDRVRLTYDPKENAGLTIDDFVAVFNPKRGEK